MENQAQSSINFGELFIRYRERGDVQAFERILEYFNRPIFNYLLRMLHKREEAEDALQEVWLRVIRQQQSYKEQGHFSSWIYRIAHNFCLDLFRKQKRTPKEEVIGNTEENLAILDMVAATDLTPLAEMLEKECAERLEWAVNQLPPLIREVYLLRSVHEIPFKEIVGIQGCPLGTVLSRMHLAITKLKGLLSEEISQTSAGTA